MAWARAGAMLLFLLLMLPGAAWAGTNNGEQAEKVVEYGTDIVDLSGYMDCGPLACVQKERSLGVQAVAAPAQSDGTALLYELPDESSAVLMGYYSGARLTVLRDVSEDFYKVQVGEPGLGITGYMRKAEVMLGLEAQREVKPAYMELQLDRDVEVYAYCDELAGRVWTARAGQTLYAMSRSDGGWVQLCLPPELHVWEEEDRPVSGFARLEPGMARGYFREMSDWAVEPCPGEPELTQMTELAISFLEAQAESFSSSFTNRASLLAMESRVFLRCREREARAQNMERLDWWVCFGDGEEAMIVHLSGYDGSRINVYASYVPRWDQGSYSIRFTL